jgi:hypothetical protein
MKRIGIVAVWTAAIALAGCGANSPTTPSGDAKSGVVSSGNTGSPGSGTADDDSKSNPPSAKLTASPSTISAGQKSILSWTTTNATAVTINGVVVTLNGSQSYSPNVTTTYTLMACNSAGSVTATATVTVNGSPTPPPPPMPTAQLKATPTTIQSGQSSTLSWFTANAATITLNGSAVAAIGARTVTPSATTTYTLVARNVTG